MLNTDEGERAIRTRTCRYHCTTCGSHFSSLGAFDAHRIGSADDRRCEDPADVLDGLGGFALTPKTERGRCDLLGNRPSLTTAVVWMRRADLESGPAPWQR